MRFGTETLSVNYVLGRQFNALGGTVIPLEGRYFSDWMHVVAVSYTFVLAW